VDYPVSYEAYSSSFQNYISLSQFFTELTMKICGSLDIEKALCESLLYIRNVMPADEIVLTSYDAELGALELVATATVGGGISHSEKIHLSQKQREEIEQPERLPRVRIADSRRDSFFQHVANRLNWEPSEIMIGRLILEGKYIGALAVRAAGKEKYNEWHKALWKMLNEPAAIALANSKRYRELERLKDRLAGDKQYLQDELRRTSGVQVVGASFGLRSVMEQVRKVATLPSAVLLHGETGTGKEVIANMIHYLSQRADGPFVKINCGAIPDSLMDSELFGHEKGAFTGALAQKPGRFERANGGTIFLDEVSELTLQAQVRLLRVIQEKEIERIGGTTTIKTDVRIISATNRDLEKLTLTGEFRKDLYFRLKVFPISIPPLRERKNDIPELAKYFVLKKSQEMALSKMPTLSPGAVDTLMSYDWPGNVRELENTVERAIILSGGLPLQFDVVLGSVSAPPLPPRTYHDEQERPLVHKDVERSLFYRALESSRGKIEGPGGAAELVGLPPWTLRRKLRKLGIDFGKRKTPFIGDDEKE
jgi:transcriptional regulator with GAF, ATPase, and Fis domain